MAVALETHPGFEHIPVNQDIACENCDLGNLRKEFQLKMTQHCPKDEHAMIHCKGELKDAGCNKIFNADQIILYNILKCKINLLNPVAVKN